MNAQDLVSAIAQLRPEYSDAQCLRIALLMSLGENDLAVYRNVELLERKLLEITIQLSATTDQHAAIAEELDSLATTEPCDFTPHHLWTLVKALKVQNQILDLYLN